MSDAIQTYGIRIKSMKENLRNIKKMKKDIDSIQKHQSRTRHRAMVQNKNNIAAETKFAQQMRGQEEKDFRKTQKALTKTQQQEAKRREQIELAAAKKQYGVQNARTRQAVGKITERAGQGRGTAAKSALADQLREEVRLEKEAHSINNSMNRLERQRVNSLEKAKAAISRSAFMMKRNADAAEKVAQQSIRTAMATSKTADELRDAVAREKANLAANKSLTREKQRQMYLQRRISESSKQFAGNYLSAFAVAGAAAGATRTGQDFQSVNNTMLAVSESSESAGENFQFVRDEAYRLGLGLTESAKGFSKMLAARGDMSVEETKNAFSGLSEMSTLLGLSAAESTRSINALQQMMSKGVVSAEELKLQMGEVLPNAIPLMAKAAKDAGLTVNGTVKEMMELQQKGGLISSKVLPYFSKRMSEAARANGGLNKALESNRVAMNRLMMSTQEGADIFFRSGFGEGLTEFFNTSAEFIRSNSDLWKALGAIVGSVLKGVAKVIKFITPIFETFGFVLRNITDLLGDFSAAVALLLSPMTVMGISRMTAGFTTMIPLMGKLKNLFTVLTAAAARFVAPLIMGFAALEEMINLFTGEKAGILRDDSDPDSYQTDRVLKFLGVKDENEKTEKPDMETFTGRLKNVGNAVLKGSPVEKLQAGLDFWKGNFQQVIEVTIDGEKVGEAVVNSESGQEGVKRVMRNDALPNY